MSEPRLSEATRSLLRAAKADGPGAAARAKVWSSVAGTVGGVAGAGAIGAAGATSTAASGSGALVTGVSASKLLAMGTLLGGTLTVGLAAVLLRVGPVQGIVPASSAPAAALAPAAPIAPSTPLELPSLDPLDTPGAGTPGMTAPAMAGPAGVAAVVIVSSPHGNGTRATGGAVATAAPSLPTLNVVPRPPSATPAHAVAPVAAPHREPPTRPSPPSEDAMAREAMLVAQAHAALERGDANEALRAVRAAERVPSHVLAPEELAIEAQALHAMGEDGPARDVDSTLKKQYPDSALAR